ncbi:hypothetical protein [Actinomadura madurae]|uniref:hypothetical protein n=1 Tax=Actinomadura madurae TaxID=1993 RepID=UPI0020D207C4|nr:hypothetical protein [Actinomadura madurae]MCP9954697.1 hypothetical protein [Actinomadura madurae]MCP9971436.1 hypothetical protein [Actinomadura madurae]MCP9983927.1 hypothetical protein [Actinomadura madurae]MCQ0004508.1 hypothetical protein [Actinomadura madurae]MCQ0020160.1 hypothetical protein [Actinomadura madurae]
MNLEAQIELITSPQDFMRLCNTVLLAEHGTDFLPIDDDRPDRGNDGYLKSEKRIFAAHCFKRIQNKALDSEILAKMTSDLRKAIELDNTKDWEVAHWTFLSNYPIPECVAVKVLKMGNAAGIDVSWLGPSYFAEVLHRFSDVRKLFPNLLANEILEKLDNVTQLLESLPTPNENIRTDRIPTNEAERDALISQAPIGWEYMLFAGVLSMEKERLEDKWRDFCTGYARRNRTYLDEQAARFQLQSIWDDAESIAGGIMSVFNEQVQFDAFGAPGEAGDPNKITHFAKRIISAYEDLLDWASDIRGSVYPSSMKRAAQLAASVATQPAEDIRSFIDQVVSEVERLLFLLSQDSNEPIILNASLTLTVNDKAISSFRKEMRKVSRNKRRF